MNYISDAVVAETIAEMKTEVASHLEYAGAAQLAPEVNAIIEDVLKKVQAKYDI